MESAICRVMQFFLLNNVLFSPESGHALISPGSDGALLLYKTTQNLGHMTLCHRQKDKGY